MERFSICAPRSLTGAPDGAVIASLDILSLPP